MEAAKPSAPRPIPYLHSYTIKEGKDAKKLQKSRLKLKNLVLYEYQIKQNKWVKTRRLLKIKKTCLTHLKGLSSLETPLHPLQIPPVIRFHKQICFNLRKLKIKMDFSLKNLERFEIHFSRMKHLTSFTDLNTNFSQKSKCLSEIKCFEQVRSLDLPCHVTPKRLDRLEKISIDLEKLEQSGEIPKLPLSLRELSLIDKNPLDEASHEELFGKLKDQLNSLKNLKCLNLVFPKKSYYHQSLIFSSLELRNVTITMRTQVDFSEIMLAQMEDYVERTSSEIKITPVGFSQPEEYLRLLRFLSRRQESNKQGIQLERVLYPFNSTGYLQRQIIEYYCKMSRITSQVEFLFELHSENGWFDEHNISNFKEIIEVIERESPQSLHIVYHFLHTKRVQLIKTTEKEIIQAAVDLLKCNLGREITIKVSSDVFGFEMLKSFMPKLFQESSLKGERIYWEHSCLYIAGLPEILNDLKSQRKIKDYSLITYQR